MDDIDIAKNRLLAALKPKYSDLIKLSNDQSLPVSVRQCVLYALGDLCLFNEDNQHE